jgi:hypothetical protein
MDHGGVEAPGSGLLVTSNQEEDGVAMPGPATPCEETRALEQELVELTPGTP